MVKKAAAPTETKVFIPEIRFEWMIVTIHGDTPLICNRCSETTIQAIEDKQTGKAANKKAPRDPEQEFMEHCHIIGGDLPSKESFLQQRFGFPAIGVKKSIATAAMRFADAEKVQLFGLITVHGPHRGLIEIREQTPVMGRDPVKPPAQNTMHIAYRAYFDPWEMAIPIRYVASAITADQLLNAIRWAGTSVGIGSWRVERGGDKGAFSIAKIERFGSEETFAEKMVSCSGLPIDGKRRFNNRPTNRTAHNGARSRHAATTG
jgi:hypothetical protein